MADEGVTLREINWREAFGFTNIFRGFRIAVHPSKLVLALVALGCLWCGGLILDAIWSHSHKVGPGEGPDYFMSANLTEQAGIPPDVREALLREHPEMFAGVFRSFWDYEIRQANSVLMFQWARTRSGGAIEAIWNFIATGPVWLWARHWFFAIIYTSWFLLVWSVFGGAISRIAAVHVARDEKISVRQAVSFSVSKVLSFIFAPVIPVLIIFLVGIGIALTATALLHIPWAGPIIVGLFFFLALLGGFVITLVILGTIGGFNLMYPTIAVEGSDSFDAISRSFSYVFARPWRMLWYTFVALIYGAICYLFVRFFVWLVLRTTWFFMALLLFGGKVGRYWPDIWPPQSITDPLGSLSWSPNYNGLKGTEAVAGGLIVWWTYLVIGLIGAFAISFYFSVNTIVYYLMRREVDATEMDDVYVEETDEEVEEPAAGAPAAVGAGAPAVVVTPTTTIVTETTTTTPAETPPSSESTEPPPA